MQHVTLQQCLFKLASAVSLFSQKHVFLFDPSAKINEEIIK